MSLADARQLGLMAVALQPRLSSQAAYLPASKSGVYSLSCKGMRMAKCARRSADAQLGPAARRADHRRLAAPQHRVALLKSVLADRGRVELLWFRAR